jgi:single-strand DNA-binding protein
MLIGVAVGRITRDAELRTTKSGISVSSFTVACNEGFGDNKRTEFVKIVLFGKRADGLNQYLTQGAALTVEGSAKSNSWISKSGESKGEIEIVADKITLQGSKQGSNAPQVTTEANDSCSELTY